MCDSVPSARYSSVSNVLHLWDISLIPTYRVYRLYDIYLYIWRILHSSTVSVGLTQARPNYTKRIIIIVLQLLLWLPALYTNSKLSRLVFQVALSLPLSFEKLLILAVEKTSSRTLHHGRRLLWKA